MLLSVNTMQPNQQNPYEFIMSPQQKKRGAGFGGGNSQKSRIIQVAIAGIVFLIIVIIFFAVLSGARKGDSENLYKIAAAQQDIVGLTLFSNNKTRNTQLTNKSVTTNVVVASQNSETLRYLVSIGIKSPTKQISALQVGGYEKTLDEAQKNGNYDDIYTALLANRIDDYRVKLQAAYSASSNTALKAQLSNYYQQLEILAPTK